MRCFVSLIILLSSLLLGCVPTAIVTSAGITVLSASDPRSTGQQIDDKTLTLRLTHAIRGAGFQPQINITATVYQGDVLLTGEVPDNTARKTVTKFVSSVTGIRHIWNEVRIGAPLQTGQKISDIWLASNIRTQLFLNSDVRLSDIKVITENSEVFLMGLVTSEEGKRIADIVSRISNVKHVTTAWILKK